MSRLDPLPAPNTVFIRKSDGARTEVHIDKDGYEWGRDINGRACRIAKHSWYATLFIYGKAIEVNGHTVCKKV